MKSKNANYIEILEGELKGARGYILFNESNMHNIKCRVYKDNKEFELNLGMNDYKTIDPRILN
jgi:hypothetical protein